MYGVINNSMGSGSVTYECEGNETRLSDCMSPLSSTIAPCYYALVKCFSISDKKSGGSITSLSSAGIVAGVVVLVVIIVIIILIVWLKRRAKNLKAGDNNANSTSPQTSLTTVIGDTEKTALNDNPSYQLTTVTTFLSGTEAGNVKQLQEKPSCHPITVVSAGNIMTNPSYQPHFPASAN